MRLCRNELLLFGGMYQVVAAIVALFTAQVFNAAGGILYILFWLGVLAISLNQNLGFVYQMNERFPRLSVFLASIGWIPYFSVIYALFSLAVDYIFSGSDTVTVFLNNYMPVYDVYMAAVVLSLLYASYKVFYKKEDLAMSCAPVIR